jgi:AbrB family looped-hinge helix DNA binding protein
MELPKSRVTAQGQISIPARIRKKLGVGPGSVLEWEEKGEHIIVRRAGQFTSADIHKAVFRRGAPIAKRIDELKEGIRSHIKKRHARD